MLCKLSYCQTVNRAIASGNVIRHPAGPLTTIHPHHVGRNARRSIRAGSRLSESGHSSS